MPNLPKMKMTTPVPEGIATPDKLETSIGTLTSVDGVPDAETTQKVYDNLDLNRATEAFLNCIPIASMYALEAWPAQARACQYHRRAV